MCFCPTCFRHQPPLEYVSFFPSIEDLLMTGTSHPCCSLSASHSCPGSFIFNLCVGLGLIKRVSSNTLACVMSTGQKSLKSTCSSCTGMRSSAVRMLCRKCFNPRAWVRIGPTALCMHRPAALSGPTYKEQWDQLEGWIVPPRFGCVTVHRGHLLHIVFPSSSRFQRHQRSHAFVLRCLSITA